MSLDRLHEGVFLDGKRCQCSEIPKSKIAVFAVIWTLIVIAVGFVMTLIEISYLL